MKKLLCFVLVALSVAFSAGAEQIRPVNVTLNGETINCASYGQPATIIDGRTMVPLRAIFETLGASVEWEQSTKTATSKLDEVEIKITIGENFLFRNDEKKELDVPALILNGRTMVPARAIAESFGVGVEWDNTTRTVVLTRKNEIIEPKENENLVYAYGKFSFGMSKQNVLTTLGFKKVTERKNEISVYYNNQECDEADKSVTGEAELVGIDFIFNGDNLVKILIGTKICKKPAVEAVLKQMTDRYGEPTEVKMDGEQLVWKCDEPKIEVKLNKYAVETGAQVFADQEYSLEMEFKYTGELFAQNEEKEAEKEDAKLIYGNFSFGMKKEEVEKETNSNKESGAVNPIRITQPEDIERLTENYPVSKVISDSEEKAAFDELSFGFENEKLYYIRISTENITLQNAQRLLENIRNVYGEHSIFVKAMNSYEWIVGGKGITATIREINNVEHPEKNHDVEIVIFENEQVARNPRFDVIRRLPIGRNLQFAINAFDAEVKVNGEKIEYFNVNDPGPVELLPKYVTVFDSKGIPTTLPVEIQSDYREEKDVLGQSFRCDYASAELVNEVFDNCFVKTTSETGCYSASSALKYVIKYYGIDQVQYNEEQDVYEWKNYRAIYPDRSFTEVDITAGIERDENDKYYCYVTVKIAG